MSIGCGPVSDSFPSPAWGAPATVAANGACAVMDGSMVDGGRSVVRWVGVLGWWGGPTGLSREENLTVRQNSCKSGVGESQTFFDAACVRGE